MRKTVQVIKRKARQLDTATQDVTGGARRGGRQVWLAALGAVSTAQDGAARMVKQLRRGRLDEAARTTWTEARRLGGELVERIGDRVELPALSIDAKSLGAALETAAAKVAHLGAQVRGSVEKGVEATLGQLGVPTRREVRQLVHRVERLTDKVERLTERRAAPRRRAPRPAGA